MSAMTPDQPHPLPDEVVLHAGPANLQRGIETVGGRLVLTSHRLLFTPHSFNIQREPLEVALADVQRVELCWTRFLGVVPLAPNSIAVHTGARVWRLVVGHRRVWQSEILQAVERLQGACADERSRTPLPLDVLWARLEQEIRSALHHDDWGFGAPARDDAIAAAEQALGVPLPAEFRRSLQIHDGDRWRETEPGRFVSAGPFAELDLLPLAVMVDEWQVWRDELSRGELAVTADDGVQPCWWHPGWIPFTVIGGKTWHHCLDLAPAERGRVGQVIEIAKDDGRRRLVAPSFAAFLESLLRDVERGALVAGERGLVPTDA